MINIIKLSFKIIPKKFKIKFFANLVLSLISILFEMLSLSLLVPFIASLTKSSIQFGKYFSYILDFLNKINYFGFGSLFFNESTKILLAILILFLLKSVFQMYFILYNASFTYDLELNIQKKILNNYLNQKYFYFHNKNSSFMQRNIINEPNNFALGVVSSYVTIISEIIILFCLFLISLMTNVYLTLSSLLLFLILILIYLNSTKKKILNYSIARFNAEGNKIKYVQEALNSIVEIKIFKVGKVFLHNFISQCIKTFKINVRYSIIKNVPKIFLELFFVFLIFVVFFAFEKHEKSGIIITLLGFFAVIYIRSIQSVPKLLASMQSFYLSSKSIQVLNDLINLDKNENKNLIKKDIQFNNYLKLQKIKFHYEINNDKKLIFDDLSIEIKKGSRIGILGESGSGKSTLLKILLGFLIPTSGKILIDDVSLTDENLDSWHDKIGYVSQNTSFLDDTLITNIAFGGNYDSEDNDNLKKIMISMRLEKFIDVNNNILNINIGEKGLNISGGEKQRISVCRALLRKPEILILDEPTTSLDKEIEKSIIHDIFKIKKTTIILVSHNHQNFKYCDYIYQLDNKILKKIK